MKKQMVEKSSCANLERTQGVCDANRLSEEPRHSSGTVCVNGDVGHEYLTTKEAASYVRRSESWLLRQPDIPYLPGKPNTYSKSDLDEWFSRSKIKPRVV